IARLRTLGGMLQGGRKQIGFAESSATVLRVLGGPWGARRGGGRSGCGGGVLAGTVSSGQRGGRAHTDCSQGGAGWANKGVRTCRPFNATNRKHRSGDEREDKPGASQDLPSDGLPPLPGCLQTENPSEQPLEAPCGHMKLRRGQGKH